MPQSRRRRAEQHVGDAPTFCRRDRDELGYMRRGGGQARAQAQNALPYQSLELWTRGEAPIHSGGGFPAAWGVGVIERIRIDRLSDCGSVPHTVAETSAHGLVERGLGTL